MTRVQNTLLAVIVAIVLGFTLALVANALGGIIGALFDLIIYTIGSASGGLN